MGSFDILLRRGVPARRCGLLLRHLPSLLALCLCLGLMLTAARLLGKLARQLLLFLLPLLRLCLALMLAVCLLVRKLLRQLPLFARPLLHEPSMLLLQLLGQLLLLVLPLLGLLAGGGLRKLGVRSVAGAQERHRGRSLLIVMLRRCLLVMLLGIRAGFLAYFVCLGLVLLAGLATCRVVLLPQLVARSLVLLARFATCILIGLAGFMAGELVLLALRKVRLRRLSGALVLLRTLVATIDAHQEQRSRSVFLVVLRIARRLRVVVGRLLLGRRGFVIVLHRAVLAILLLLLRCLLALLALLLRLVLLLAVCPLVRELLRQLCLLARPLLHEPSMLLLQLLGQLLLLVLPLLGLLVALLGVTSAGGGRRLGVRAVAGAQERHRGRSLLCIIRVVGRLALVVAALLSRLRLILDRVVLRGLVLLAHLHLVFRLLLFGGTLIAELLLQIRPLCCQLLVEVLTLCCQVRLLLFLLLPNVCGRAGRDVAHVLLVILGVAVAAAGFPMSVLINVLRVATIRSRGILGIL
mmetsp:Transcript_8785/g.23874  ORF Transcript_8785/g.23874 Transcript_8785/m.23874 type:complete len:523 (+) Transcript_8785:196-1764(+)